jgi:hypothetical protein
LLLVAVWRADQNVDVDEPAEVHWGDGNPATLSDYHRHAGDTHQFREGASGQKECHIFTEIVADLAYDKERGAWRLTGKGVIEDTSDITDPLASDDDLYVYLMSLDIQYRTNIRR